MFKQAVQHHNAVAATTTSPPNASYKQVSLGNTLDRFGNTQKAATRPLNYGMKQNTAGVTRPSRAVTQGIKRTSNGLAKSISSQEDNFDYPTLHIAGMEKENDLPPAFHTTSRSNSASLATALFDENDFDSDIDLDVEDPATKGTVTYPTLPQLVPAGERESGYQSRPPTAQVKPELNSSQPIPWSSSPVEHFKTPSKSKVSLAKPVAVKAEPVLKTSKRSFLPWTQVSKAQSTQELDQIDSEEEPTQPKKRKSVEPAKVAATPAPKEVKSDYLWNTTASAVKQQQKNFKEQMKAQTKTVKGTDEEVKEAMRKKNKNSVHRIFLSEEQQNVLNLVTEYKKSVFFTGSAGMINVTGLTHIVG